MELAVCISNENDCSFYETVDGLSAAGFKNVFVQWYEREGKKLNPSQYKQLEYIKSKDLNVIFAHLGYRNMNIIWENNLDGEIYANNYIEDLIELNNLGIKNVMMHICVGNEAPSVNDVGLERFKKICNKAKELGMTIAFENTKLKGYQEYILNNIDNAYICFDSGHMHCHFKDDYNFKLFKDKVKFVHLHDNYGQIDDHLIPYDGTLDWDLVINGLKEANYNGYVTLELCYRNEYKNMSVEDFYKKGYETGLKLIKKLK